MGNSSEHELFREGEISPYGTELPQAEIEELVSGRALLSEALLLG